MWKLERIVLLATESFLRKLRQRLLIILLIAVLPILAVIFYQAKIARDVRIAEAQERAWEITENVAIREARFIDSAKQLLTLLADTPEVMNGETAACSEFLRRFVKHSSVYVDLGIADPNGRVRCASRSIEAGESVLNESLSPRAGGARLRHR
jgi:hypothetical protein